MNDKNIRLVALDLDGTTLNEQGELTERTIESFRNAMEKGAHIVICTGRTFASLPKQLFQIEGLEYVVTSNGAKITRLKDLVTIYEDHIPAKAVEQIADILKVENCSLEVFVDGKAYIGKEEYEEYLHHGSDYRDVEYILRTRNPIENFFDFIYEHKERMENINISFPRTDDRATLLSLLEPVENVTLTTSFVHNLEVGGGNTSKAEALRFLMRELGLSQSQLMAVGDSHNDLEMIKLAEVGVVMENGSDEMKSYADFVTASNAEDGVALAIEKFVK